MGNGGHLVKWLYTGIRAHAAITLTALRNKWASDSDTEITDKAWSAILEHPKRVSRNAKLKFIQTMVLHRSYLTPQKIHKMYPEAQHCCPRCKGDEADFTHMLWSCPQLQNYWKDIPEVLNEITHLLIPNDILACLVGPRKRTSTSKVQMRFQGLALILSIRNLTMRWKSPRCPSLNTWQS